MKNINEIVASLNVARSNDCSKEKSEEFKSIIQDLLPYAKLEERLGIDLITLIKALEGGIYIKTKQGEIKGTSVTLSYDCDCYNEWLSNFRSTLVSSELHTAVNIRDYGKDWALKKEELL